MPLLRIDIIRGRSAQERRALADTLHACVVEAFGVPVRDRFQIITEHEPDQMIIEDVGLGLARTRRIVVVQITSTPRSLASRKSFYRLAAERLQAECGLGPADLMINIVTVSESDWSFGLGRAQFLTGDL
ncbi:tautomerase family protein [Poseidonocella sp. HB161398]|uniref:tautomerase family protein n=1 Tax=Poseidonocella sp. HB161398 TaxID=2320855 RepID=UPI001109F8B7|nr:tautomerase family protein [Poseidonocella sp. HB161398]